MPHPRARALQPGWNLPLPSTPQPHPTPSSSSPQPQPLLFNSSRSPRPLFLCFRCLTSQSLARWGVYPVPPAPSPPPRSGGSRLALAHPRWRSGPGTFSVGNAPAAPAGSREHGCRAGPLPWARLCPLKPVCGRRIVTRGLPSR